MLVPARVALVLGSLALLAGGSLPANADSDSARSEIVGHVYVNDNTAPANSIGAFDRHANGNLTPMSGSPFTISGAGTGAIVRDGWTKVCAYRDEEGMLHKHSAVCPHLGCIVAWNAAEHSWDCPCHGSRFDPLGRVVQGPAIGDLAPAEEKVGAH